MGIVSQEDYKKKYKLDPLLPAAPYRTYDKEWISWGRFLGRADANPYPSLVEASTAARKMGIETAKQYRNRSHEDDRLPFNPDRTYGEEWVSWASFLGTDNEYRRTATYDTLQEAKSAVSRLGIRSQKQYRLLYRKDPMLPAAPEPHFAKAWLGWRYFLGKPEIKHYKTMSESMAAVRRLGIKGEWTYRRQHHLDSMLPSNPQRSYKASWVSWPHFFGGNISRPPV